MDIHYHTSIPFKDVAIGQAFEEEAESSVITRIPWVKCSEHCARVGPGDLDQYDTTFEPDELCTVLVQTQCIDGEYYWFVDGNKDPEIVQYREDTPPHFIFKDGGLQTLKSVNSSVRVYKVQPPTHF